MFLRFRLSVTVLIGYSLFAIAASLAIQAEWWSPPFEPTEMRRGFVGESISIAMIAAALSLPAAWKELRSRRLVEMERDAQAEANKERRRFESVVNSSYGAIVEADAKGRIVFAQGPLIESYGYRPDQLLERDQLEFLPTEDRRKWLRFIRDLKSGYSEEARLLDAAGRERWVNLSGGAFTDSNGSRKYVTAIRDVEQEVRARNHMQEMTRP